jgi:DNA-binding transcriptional ArsR family regulator
MRDLPLYEVKADLFRGLAHPVRVRILELVTQAEEVPVARLLAETGLQPPHMSQHLAVLRKYGLIMSERRGSQVFCWAADPSVGELLAAARSFLSHTLRVNGRVADSLADALMES